MVYSDSNPPCPIETVVERLHLKVKYIRGDEILCQCPFCQDRKAHLGVNLAKNVFHCFRCGAGGGVLKLYGDAFSKDEAWAAEQLGVRSERWKNMERRAVKRNYRELPEPPRDEYRQERDAAYQEMLRILPLSQKHREALIRRGLTDEDVTRLGYASVPVCWQQEVVRHLLEKGVTMEGVPGFSFDRTSATWQVNFPNKGILVPDRNADGQIEAIQIRLDHPVNSKFLNFTSVGKWLGTSASCCPHYAGVEPGMQEVYLTEGVMKSDVAHSLSLQLGEPRGFVGLTGVANYGQFQRASCELWDRGVRRIYLAFDMDYITNDNVRNARSRVLEMGRKAGFQMIPLNWSQQYKGIDDMLLARRSHLTAKEDQN